MKDLLYRVLGRASLVFDPLRTRLATDHYPSPKRDSDGERLDRTGLLVLDARRLTILWDDPEVLFVEYDSLAHSLWRAQELSLFRRHQAHLTRPLLDFGMGDGSFASVLFEDVDYGADTDPDALDLASRYGVYRRLIQSTPRSIPLDSASVGTVFSNSVLEHVVDLPAILAELHRILRSEGALVFTAPVRHFSTHIAKYFGTPASERVNAESSHRNLLDANEWIEVLGRHGFQITLLQHYQPDWFTFWYRMCRLVGPRGLGRIIPGLRSWIWRHRGTALVEMVRKSVSGASEGANIFVVAKKAA